MQQHRTALADDDISRALAHDRLGVPAVVFFVMSAAAPLMYVAGVATTGFAVTGLIGLPVAFVTIGLALSLFSVGYVTMGRYLPHAGAFYAYVSHGLGRVFGVGAAWVALLSYNSLQIGLYGVAGVAAGPLVQQFTGLELPWWIFALLAWALVSVLGVLRVDLNGGVLAVLLCAEVLVLVIYNISYLSHPAHSLDLSALSPTVLFQPGIGALLALAVLGFTGFESSVVFSEESRDPRRTIPLATFTSIALIAFLYGLSSWALGVTTGTDKVVQAAQEQGPGLVFGTATGQLGPFFGDLGNVLFLTSIIASLISFHNTTARYIFALGRERVLPSVFGGTSHVGAPYAGSLAQSVIAFLVIVLYAVKGWDPLVQLFYLLGTSGGYGAIILIAWTSIAVFVFFRKDSHGEAAWRVQVAPALAIVAMVGVLVLATVNFSTLMGLKPDDPLRWVVPVVFLVVGLLGIGYGSSLRVARPDVYAAIGMGAKSTSSGVLAPSASVSVTVPQEQQFWFGGPGR